MGESLSRLFESFITHLGKQPKWVFLLEFFMKESDVKQMIFEYLKDNLQIDAELIEGGGNYGYDNDGVKVTVMLRNPEGDFETIATSWN